MINTGAFTGKAQAYAEARPGYPDEAIDYIRALVPADAVFVDIGAGTGKFTELIARYGYRIFAVEPNEDMRKQLAITLLQYQNVSIIDSAAEETTLPDSSVDVITCAQSLGWLDLNAFRAECHRIGKHGATVISLCNTTPGDKPALSSQRQTSEQASDMFFCKPDINEFQNPLLYSKERWFQLNASISDNPLPSSPEHAAHITRINEIFDRDNVDGLLRCDYVTKVYSESIE